MKFTTSLSVALLSAASLLSSASAGRSPQATGKGRHNIDDMTAQFFNDAHQEKIARHKHRHNNNNVSGGYQILPPHASPAQCNLALQRIAQQPRSCAEQYMARAARNVYLPIYDWFDPEQLANNAAQYSLDNGVAIKVSDAFGKLLVETAADGSVVPAPYPIPAVNVEFTEARTFALNYPTFVRDEVNSLGRLQQIVYGADAQMVLVEIMVPLSQLPVVC